MSAKGQLGGLFGTARAAGNALSGFVTQTWADTAAAMKAFSEHEKRLSRLHQAVKDTKHRSECSRCKGTGGLSFGHPDSESPAHDCPKCGGTGFVKGPTVCEEIERILGMTEEKPDPKPNITWRDEIK